MRFLSTALLSVIILLFPIIRADEDIGLCCLCEGCVPTVRKDFFVDRAGKTCSELNLEMADPTNQSKPGNGHCKRFQAKHRRTCCDSKYDPPPVVQNPTPAPNYGFPLGQYKRCDICEDGSEPTKPYTQIAILKQFMPEGLYTCAELYRLGRTGNIHNQICDPLVDYAETPCGCVHHPPTASPTETPTRSPTRQPTRTPTQAPTRSPSSVPTRAPVTQCVVCHGGKTLTVSCHAVQTHLNHGDTLGECPPPTVEPTVQPTAKPTRLPTRSPTRPPTQQPSQQPTAEPTGTPTVQPTRFPTQTPTIHPTNQQPTPPPTTLHPTTPPLRDSPTMAPTTTDEPTRALSHPPVWTNPMPPVPTAATAQPVWVRPVPPPPPPTVGVPTAPTGPVFPPPKKPIPDSASKDDDSSKLWTTVSGSGGGYVRGGLKKKKRRGV